MADAAFDAASASASTRSNKDCSLVSVASSLSAWAVSARSRLLDSRQILLTGYVFTKCSPFNFMLNTTLAMMAMYVG
jgi:hypothetical protein